jgi:hypothetical protein
MLILDLYFLRLAFQICFRGLNLKASAGVALSLSPRFSHITKPYPNMPWAGR